MRVPRTLVNCSTSRRLAGLCSLLYRRRTRATRRRLSPRWPGRQAAEWAQQGRAGASGGNALPGPVRQYVKSLHSNTDAEVAPQQGAPSESYEARSWSHRNKLLRRPMQLKPQGLGVANPMPVWRL